MTMCRRFEFHLRAFMGAFLIAVFLVVPLGASGTRLPVLIHQINEAVLVDGKANEAGWEKAEPLSFDFFCDAETSGEKQETTLRMLWDRENLYLFYDCKDRFITARETQHDGMPFFDDCAEIFIMPTTDLIDMHFAFEINLFKKANDIILLNQLYRGKNIAVKGYDPAYQVEVQINGTLNDNSDVDEGWTMEVAIPLKAFRTAWAIPQHELGAEWRFMAVRLDRNKLEGNDTSMSTVFCLSGNRKEVHNPTHFGTMKFVASDGMRTSSRRPVPNRTATVKVPRIGSEYIPVYKPAGAVFQGPGTEELTAGTYYEEWVPNDHCFVKDAGRWHAFGITHPITSFDNIHQGETQSFHAIAPKGAIKDALLEGSWKDLAKVLPPADRPGESHANHAPFIVKRNDRYHMIYGPTPIRYAVSEDLINWTPKGPLGNTPAGRDPSVLYYDGIYYLTVCGEHKVWAATSTDLKMWTQHGAIMTMPEGIDPESPSIVRYNDTFYLFVCGWNGEWDRKKLQGAYQHKTFVYQSDNPFKFERKIAEVNAHAPEIFQDEEGDWFISSVEWPHRGVSIARLNWE